MTGSCWTFHIVGAPASPLSLAIRGTGTLDRFHVNVKLISYGECISGEIGRQGIAGSIFGSLMYGCKARRCEFSQREDRSGAEKVFWGTNLGDTAVT